MTLEDVPDSWDGNGEPQVDPMWCPWPYFSCGKGLRLISLSSSEISAFRMSGTVFGGGVGWGGLNPILASALWPPLSVGPLDGRDGASVGVRIELDNRM